MENIAQSSHPRQSKMLEHPATPANLHRPLDPMLILRRKRAVALVPTVQRTTGGYRVSSSNLRTEYLVTQPNGHKMCTCPDYQKHAPEPGFRCKHILAVEMGLDQGLVPMLEKEPQTAPAASTQPLAVVSPAANPEAPVRLKLIKNTKGYSWEISVADQSGEQALAQVKALEAQVRATFGAAEAA